jgi:pilus assembly protein CpaB
MNKRLAGVLAFALIVAAGASYLVYRFLGERLAASAEQPAQELIVPIRRLDIGVLVQESDLTVTDWNGPIPPNALNTKEEIVGRGVLTAIYPGEPISNDRLAEVGAGAGMAATIPKGMRAVAVRVNDIVGVAGFVTPGMRVDLLIMGTPPNSPESLGTLAKTLLQNIEVLSAGQQIQKDNEGKPIRVNVINLLVTPEQAETISLASSNTKIQLVLRNPLDTEEVKTPGTAVSKLFADNKSLQPAPGPGAPRRASPPPLIPRKKPPVIVEVIHGAKKVETKFEDQNTTQEK